VVIDLKHIGLSNL